MEERIAEIVASIWTLQREELVKRLNSAHRDIKNLLELEEHYRHGHSDESRLSQSLGGFGEGLLNVSSMSELLSKGDETRAMPPERYERIKQIDAELAKAERELTTYAPSTFTEQFTGDTEKHIEQFEKEANNIAKVCAVVRMAKLESSARFEERHLDFFKRFDWRDLDNGEAALCPATVVFVNAQPGLNLMGKVLELASAGRPLKVLYLSSGVEDLVDVAGERGRATVLQSRFHITTLPLALRNVYFLQCIPNAEPAFEERIKAAICSPRPAVISLFRPGKLVGEKSKELAIQSRAFPQLMHDPDDSPESISSVTLLDNPEITSVWCSSQLDYLCDNDKSAVLNFRITYADFAAVLVPDSFEPLSADVPAEQRTPVADYLDLSRKERERRVPYISIKGSDGRLKQLRVPREVVIGTVERMQLWKMLQELSGVANPLVQTAEQKLRETLTTEKEQALASLQSEVNAKIESREQAAVQAAITNLAKKLSGLAGDPPPKVAAPAAPKPAASSTTINSPEGEKPAPTSDDISEEAWINSVECTSCDDCITLNSQIFAYNENKKAYVKNPRGGPFKDIVRAAEKCPAMVIHPGKPHDPKEKGLDKLIARAAKFQ